jgi:cobalt-zinc-cadmium efflux system outer membrane protein
VRKLVDAGTLRSADLIVAQTEVATSRDLVAAAGEFLVLARAELYRALGVAGAPFQIRGRVSLPSLAFAEDALLDAAVDHRADLHAGQAAVAQAEANVRLAVANRFGNPTLGPAYTYDPTRVNEIGGQLNIPLPVCNTHRGEIMQREAERDRAFLDLRQTEVLVQQDVLAALARLNAAQARVETYRTQILPELRKGIEGMEELFKASAPGVDVLRVIDVRRKYLGAQSTYLDALWNVTQARADLVAAVGDPALLGINLCAPSPEPPNPQPQD